MKVELNKEQIINLFMSTDCKYCLFREECDSMDEDKTICSVLEGKYTVQRR